MIIKFNGGWRLSTDAYNWILEQEGGNGWAVLGYYRPLASALTAAAKLKGVTRQDLSSVEQAVAALDAAEAQVREVLDPWARSSVDHARRYRPELLPPGLAGGDAIEIDANWWLALEWVTNRDGKNRTKPVTWQFVLGEPRLREDGEGLRDKFARPTYYGGPARALAAYLDVRTRRAESLVEVPAICESAIRAAYLCRGEVSTRLARARHGAQAAGVGGHP